LVFTFAMVLEAIRYLSICSNLIASAKSVNVFRALKVFIQAISVAPLQVRYYSEVLQHSTDTVPEFHAEAPQASVS